MRIVFDLKTEVSPQLFALAPVAEFGHRVVLDLYPLTPVDPLMALLAEDRGEPQGDTRPPAPSAPNRAQLNRAARVRTSGSRARARSSIAIDPGHGGEDPGAIGPRGTYEKNVTLAIAKKLKRDDRRRAATCARC